MSVIDLDTGEDRGLDEVALFTIALDHGAIREIQRHWRSLVALGVALIALGVVALCAVIPVTFASVLLFGWLLGIAGVLQIVQGWRLRRWAGVSRHLPGGVLSLVVGVLLVANPAAGAWAITLLLAAFFIAGGIFRIAAHGVSWFPGRGWTVLGGVVSLMLGVLVVAEWPVSSVWLIGTLVGIDLFLDGYSLAVTGLSARALPSWSASRAAVSADSGRS